MIMEPVERLHIVAEKQFIPSQLPVLLWHLLSLRPARALHPALLAGHQVPVLAQADPVLQVAVRLLVARRVLVGQAHQAAVRLRAVRLVVLQVGQAHQAAVHRLVVHQAHVGQVLRVVRHLAIHRHPAVRHYLAVHRQALAGQVLLPAILPVQVSRALAAQAVQVRQVFMNGSTGPRRLVPGSIV